MSLDMFNFANRVQGLEVPHENGVSRGTCFLFHEIDILNEKLPSGVKNTAYILTAYHVVKDYIKGNSDNMILRGPLSSYDIRPKSSFYEDDITGRDIALFIVEPDLFPGGFNDTRNLYFVRKADSMYGANLYYFGYPEVFGDRQKRADVYKPIVRHGVGGAQFENEIWISGDGSKGFSGSPIIAKGEDINMNQRNCFAVLGVLTSKTKMIDGNSVFVRGTSIDFILEGLKSVNKNK